MKKTEKKVNIMKSLKRALALLLCLTLFPFVQVQATPMLTSIPICVENLGFSATNCAGDGGSTLIWTRGTTVTAGGVLRLASNTSGQSGTAVRRNRIKLDTGFSTYFVMNLNSMTSYTPADGLTFIIQDNDTPQLGTSGGGVGYDGIGGHSAAVEFDIYQNTDAGDPNANHVAIDLNGSVDHHSSPAQTAAYGLYGNRTYVWVEYEASSGTMTVTYNNSNTRTGAQTISKVVDAALQSAFSTNDVFVGFAASTGGSNANHDIEKWYFSDKYVAGGLNASSSTYQQGASVIDISCAGINPSDASITIKDASGALMNNEIADIYLDSATTPVGNIDTGSGGLATFIMPTCVPGDHIIKAVARSGGATNRASFKVKGIQTITFASMSQVTYGDPYFSLNATSDSGLPVAYTSSNTNVAQVSGDIVTIIGAGSTDITAFQAGNSNYFATGDIIRTLTVLPKTITVGGTFTVKNKVHDGNTSATIDQNNLTLIGLATGDVVNITPILKYADSNVGNGKIVSIESTSTLDNQNYVLSIVGAPTATANITAAPGSGSDKDKDKTPVVPMNPSTGTGGSGTTTGGTATGGSTVGTTNGTSGSTGTGVGATGMPTTGYFDVIVGGVKQEPAGQMVLSQDSAGKSIATVEVQTDKINEILNKLSGETSNAEAVNRITIPAVGNHDMIISELNGQMIKDMENKQVTLEIKTDKAIYVLPAREIDINSISNELGKNVGLSDIKVEIEIKTPSKENIKIIANALDENKYSIVIPSVEFKITCKLEDKTINIEKFNSYLERLIPIPEGVDPSKVTTAVVTDEMGNPRQVPTKLTVIDGKTYAEVNTLTNSIYTVIWNPLTFIDTQNVWAGKDMDNIASRIIMPGITKDQFNPGGAITKGDFIAALVKALGLKESTYKAIYKDVKAKDKNAGFIVTAYEYGLIGKTKDGKLHGEQNLVRKEMFESIINGMKVTKLKAKVSAAEKSSILSMYLDAAKTSETSLSMVATLNKANIMSYNTFSKIRENELAKRSEAAHYIIWLLKSSSLID